MTSIKQKSLKHQQKIRIADTFLKIITLFKKIFLIFSSPKEIDKAFSDLSGRRLGFKSSNHKQ